MRKKIKNLSLVLLALLILSGSIYFADTKASAYTDVRDGVVSVVLFLYNAQLCITDGMNVELVKSLGDIEFGGGTGFFVGEKGKNPQYVITNNHVVETFIAKGEGNSNYVFTETYHESGYPYVIFFDSSELRVYYDDNDYEMAFVEDYGDTDKVDLAILKLRKPTDKRRALPLGTPPEVGTDVYVVGYPSNADNEYTAASHYSMDDASVTKGAINKYAQAKNGVERIQTDAVIHHGNSGGPLVTEEGYVIGVNTNVFSRSPFEGQVEADYYSISVSHVEAMLKRNDISYSTYNGKSGGHSGKKMPGGVLAAIIVAAVVVIGAAAAVLVVARNKRSGMLPKGKGNAPGNGGYTPSPAPAQSGGGAKASAAAVAKKAVVRSVAAQHRGAIFALSGAPILVGRTPGVCTVVYQQGTAGVSGKHCSISYDASTEDFIVTDLGSSYGTFLMSGQKLAPNMPMRLKTGASLYVGDRANVLVLELL